MLVINQLIFVYESELLYVLMAYLLLFIIFVELQCSCLNYMQFLSSKFLARETINC